MEPISSQHGIEGTRQRLQDLWVQATDAEQLPAFNRLFGEPGRVYPGDARPSEGTMRKLVENSNAMINEIAELRGRLDAVPFPFRASS